MKGCVLCSLLFSLICKTWCQDNTVHLPNTAQRTIISTTSGLEYQLYLYTPGNDVTSAKKYPVFYVLDGQWNFATTLSLADGLYADGAIPNAVIVGITWPGEHPDYDSLREAAFTPAATKDIPHGGGAATFLNDIQKSIIPYIDSAYRTDTANRLLLGGSLGGLFVAYALIKSPGLFNHFIMASPALNNCKDTLLKLARDYMSLHNTLNAKLFVGIGDQDRFLSSTTTFIKTIKEAMLSKLQVSTELFKNTGHAAGIAEGISQGLRSAFAKSTIHLNPTTLDAYTGTYAGDQNDNFPIFRRNNKLFMRYDTNTSFELCAETAFDFFIRGVPLFFTFSKDAAGRIQGVTIKHHGGEGYYKKVKVQRIGY
jgi:predicted alpha/beta superfamily hydrolase